MTGYKNTRKINFLSSIPKASFESEEDTITKRCKFNFSYFDVQASSQNFSDWSQESLAKLLDKLKHYSMEPLEYWRNKGIGKSGKVLTVYGSFPKKSKLTWPNHIPHQAEWARFRLQHKERLVGFVIPAEFGDKPHQRTGVRYDVNTFYVVFLDESHSFYCTD